MQPVRNHKKTGAEIKDMFVTLQKTKAPPLKILSGDEALENEKKAVYEIDAIQPTTKTGKKRWQYLHNTPCIKVLSEKDYMSHKDGLTTVIRFVRFIEEETSEELLDDLLPE